MGVILPPNCTSMLRHGKCLSLQQHRQGVECIYRKWVIASQYWSLVAFSLYLCPCKWVREPHVKNQELIDTFIFKTLFTIDLSDKNTWAFLCKTVLAHSVQVLAILWFPSKHVQKNNAVSQLSKHPHTKWSHLLHRKPQLPALTF